MRIRRITVIVVTMLVTLALFLAFDAWWRAGETNYWKMIYLIVGCTLRKIFGGPICLFI
jgi:hypothetical protein